MAKKMKIRAFINDGGITVVKALMFHPMETGLRKDKKTGKPIPAHFIQEVEVKHNDNKVLNCLWGPVVSKNPFLSFDISGTKAGDKVQLTWTDNTGASESASATIS